MVCCIVETTLPRHAPFVLAPDKGDSPTAAEKFQTCLQRRWSFSVLFRPHLLWSLLRFYLLFSFVEVKINGRVVAIFWVTATQFQSVTAVYLGSSLRHLLFDHRCPLQVSILLRTFVLCKCRPSVSGHTIAYTVESTLCVRAFKAEPSHNHYKERQKQRAAVEST